MHILHEKYSTVPNKRVYMAIYFAEKFAHIQEKRQKKSPKNSKQQSTLHVFFALHVYSGP